MTTMTLCRYKSDDQGTFGVLYHDDWWCFTLELPWRDNKANISCIPAGEYKVTRRYSPSFKRETYWIKDVPNRGYILIHSANFAGDTSKGWHTNLKGCVTLGMVTAVAKNPKGKFQECVSRSREAIRKLENKLGKKDFNLIIKDVYVDNIS